MKVTIITAVRNNKDEIKGCLDSVASQSGIEFEHIIQDSNSTDGTTEIIKSSGYQHINLSVEGDNGIYDALNKAMARASGDIIGLLHSDDLYQNDDVLKIVLDHFERGAQVVYGDLNYVSKESIENIFRKWESGKFSRNNLSYGWMPPHPSFFFRSDLLKQVGEYDSTYKIAADYDFMIKILLLPNIQVSYIPKTLVRMRVGGASNRSFSNILLKMIEDYKTMRKYFSLPLFTLICKNLRKLNQIKISYFKKS